jgi:hypothetical protein
MTWTPAASFARNAVVFLILIAPSTASAALGGSAATVDADRVQLQGALMRIVKSDTYALHEIRSASGIMIREFVNSSGTVFAVAWDGPWMPNLQQVLGDRFPQYQAAMRARQRTRRVRGAVALNEPGLIVQLNGHPRAFSGHAYDPTLMPQGMQVEAIK